MGDVVYNRLLENRDAVMGRKDELKHNLEVERKQLQKVKKDVSVFAHVMSVEQWADHESFAAWKKEDFGVDGEPRRVLQLMSVHLRDTQRSQWELVLALRQNALQAFGQTDIIGFLVTDDDKSVVEMYVEHEHDSLDWGGVNTWGGEMLRASSAARMHITRSDPAAAFWERYHEQSMEDF